MALKDELKYFESIKANLLKTHNGKYVLIKDKQIIGFYRDGKKAMIAGYKKFGTAPFLVRPIKEKRDVFYFTSSLLKLS